MARKTLVALLFLVAASPSVAVDLTPEELAAAGASDDVCEGSDEGQCSLELRQLRAEQKTAEVQPHEYEQEQEDVVLLSVETSHVLDVDGEPSLALEQEEDAKGDCIKCDIGTGCKLTWLNAYKKCPTNAPYYSLSKDNCSNNPSCAAGSKPSGHKPSPSPGKYSPSPSPGKYSPSPSPGKYSPSPSPSKYSPSPSPGKYSPSPAPGKCQTQTGGSCKIMGCAKSRGTGVVCQKGKCVCKPGYCSSSTKNGKCKHKALLEQELAERQARPEGMWEETTWQDVMDEEDLHEAVTNASLAETAACDDDTYGSCSVFSCSKSRGPTNCVHGKCKCPPGHCAKGGACFAKQGNCLSQTTGSCSVLSCAKSRGETKCKSGECLCKTGHCAWKGKCYADTDTGGSCSVLSCASSRGPTVCHRGRCVCKSGYVAVAGRCERASFS